MKTHSDDSDDLDCLLPMQNEKYLVFMDKNYPINFKIFQTYSLFFSKNQQVQNEQFLIFDYPNFITDYSFDSFISACQNKMFKINKANAIALHYLSKRFEVPILKHKTEEYIEEHHKKLLIESFKYKIFMIEEISKTSYQISIDKKDFFDGDEFFDITYETKTLGESFNQYLEEKNTRDFLMSLPIPTLYKIIQQFVLTHSQDYENLDLANLETNPILNFMIEYITRNGNQASIIFSLFHFSIDDIKQIENKKKVKIDNSYLNNSVNITKEEFINKNIQSKELFTIKFNELEKQIDDLQNAIQMQKKADKIIENYIYQEMKNK